MKEADTIKCGLIEAAVIVPVYRNTMGAVRIILVRRSAGGVHGGQLAFPGGKQDTRDSSLLETALRETKEEIGLVVRPESVMAHLPKVITKTTGFRVSPFLCSISPPQTWTLSEREIAEVLDVGLDDLSKQEKHFFKMLTKGDDHKDSPYYAIADHKLWGVTYRILQPVVRKLMDSEWVF